MIHISTSQLAKLLSEDERRLLIDIIDIHVMGVEQAKELTTDDPTIESAEQLLDLMAGYDDDLALLAQIRRNLNSPPTKRRLFGKRNYNNG